MPTTIYIRWKCLQLRLLQKFYCWTYIVLFLPFYLFIAESLTVYLWKMLCLQYFRYNIFTIYFIVERLIVDFLLKKIEVLCSQYFHNIFTINHMWELVVLVSSIGKVSDGWIKDLRFNLCLHQKLIGRVLVWYTT